MKTKLVSVVFIIALMCVVSTSTYAQSSAPSSGKKPNILVIWGDDIGWYNPSIYNRGDMGYQTPNIDRVGKEGAMFTCWYGQQSYTAGRAAFITGQSPIRTGLTKVGLPGADVGLSAKDPTIAECRAGTTRCASIVHARKFSMEVGSSRRHSRNEVT